jgi:peptidoglycan/xylan/chitin deacetylase (PgdA/CDA1 family)
MSLVTNSEQTAAKLELLRDERDLCGWDFINHTTDHTALSGQSLAAQTTKIGDAQTYLNANGFHGDYFVQPQASRDANTDTACANLSIKTQTYNNSSPYWFDLATVSLQALNRFMLGNTTTLAAAKAQVDAAKANNGTVIFEGHQLVASPATTEQWTPQDFKDLVDYCIAQGVAIITMHDLYRLRTGPVVVRKQ